MKGKPQQLDAMKRRRWQSGWCVLLAVLLLYNPFVAIYCSHSHSSVHTPQRNRATVGSSELQHYGFVQQEIQNADLAAEENGETVATPAEIHAAYKFGQEPKVTQPDIRSRFWSRPPPTL
jgi:hypothetical protein